MTIDLHDLPNEQSAIATQAPFVAYITSQWVTQGIKKMWVMQNHMWDADKHEYVPDPHSIMHRTFFEARTRVFTMH